LAVICWTLNSYCRAIIGNPDYATHPFAFRTFCVITYFDHVLVSAPPLSHFSSHFQTSFLKVKGVRKTNFLFLDFLLNNRLTLLISHNLLNAQFEKVRLLDRFSLRIIEAFQIQVCCRKYKHMG
jgi:hypothetical protein